MQSKKWRSYAVPKSRQRNTNTRCVKAKVNEDLLTGNMTHPGTPNPSQKRSLKLQQDHYRPPKILWTRHLFAVNWKTLQRLYLFVTQ
jgi:hypothetical protein